MNIHQNTEFLILEDDPPTKKMWEHVFSSQNLEFDLAINGQEGLERLKKKNYDVLIVDWMMPEHNGIEFIKSVRTQWSHPPLILMVTANATSEARALVQEVGADYFFSKPLKFDLFFSVVEEMLSIIHQKPLLRRTVLQPAPLKKLPLNVGVVIGGSTGGIVSIKTIFKDWPENFPASFFVVQHGPNWMLENIANELENISGLNSQMAEDNLAFKPGSIYVAPAGRHLSLTKNFTLKLTEGPKENFVIPAADPLFRSAAKVFGKFCIGLILSGLGSDGTLGAAQIHATGGSVWAQDPSTTQAPSMPKSAIQAGVVNCTLPLENIRETLKNALIDLSRNLEQEKSKTL